MTGRLARVEIHRRPIPERLQWLADHLETEGTKPGVRLGVAIGLRMIAEELKGDDLC